MTETSVEHARFERGPLIRYEVVWKSGHIDTFQAHQVSHVGDRGGLFIREAMGLPALSSSEPERIRFHGEFDGKWQLVLDAPADEIATIRNLSVCGDGLGASSGGSGADQ